MENAGITPVMPVGNMMGDGFGYGGGAWFMWIIVLFFLIGGNGAWNNNRGDVARIQDVYAANDSQSLRQAVNNLGNGIADATFSLNNNILGQSNLLQRDILQGDFMLDKSIMGAANNLGGALAENRFAQQHCCCETNRNIDAVRYENAANTCKITTNANEGTQKILDKLASMEFNAMKSENDNLRMALANERNINVQYMQTRDIIGAVRPFPQPSFLVGNPYVANGSACGYAAYNA